MKGRPQEKNGYWYVVIYRGKGLSPKWISTGLKTSECKRLSKKAINDILENYEAQVAQEASAPLNPALTDVKNQYIIDEPDSPLFSEIIKCYLDIAQSSVKINTYEKYHAAAHKHIIPWFEERNIAISNITSLDIQEYCSGKLKSGLSKGTLKYHKTVINQTFEYAIFPLKLVSNNPAAGIKIGKSRAKPLCYYEPSMLNELIAMVSSEGSQIATPVILAAYYGLRREEALGLEWSAVDFKRKTILICRTAVKTNSGTVFSYEMKSESSLRTMPLFPAVETYLKSLYMEQRAMKAIYKKAYPKHNDICRWPDGRLVRPDYVTSRFRELIKKYDMPALTFHQLRHSSASLLVNEGHSLREVQEWLGHASSRSTEVYAHMFHEAKNKMAVSIGSALITPETTVVSGF